jgi:hypothetical protein
MNTFALITEGKTDQIVIENILAGYFKTRDLDVNELQPPGDETDKNRGQNFGGWHKVFEYCQSDEFKGAFQFNDYVIVQIDTDVSEEAHYDIPKYENAKDLSPGQLIKKVVEKFKNLMTSEFYAAHKDRIIFAISVHSIECWLLPLYYTDKRKAKTVNCPDTVDKTLRKKRLTCLQDKNGKKNTNSYKEISKAYCKHKKLMECYKENPSFKVFIKEVEKRNIIIQEDDF